MGLLWRIRMMERTSGLAEAPAVDTGGLGTITVNAACASCWSFTVLW